MNLYTCCPNCRTTFRVTTAQLQASVGQVRCGFCNGVFDAFATLTAREPQGLQATEPPAVPPADEPTAPAVAPEPAVEAAEPTTPSPTTPASTIPLPPRPDPAAALYEWEFRMPAPPRRTGLWIALCVLMLLALAAQAAFVWRTEISLLYPPAHEWVRRLCTAAGCEVFPARLSSHLHIEASDLKAVDAGTPSQIELTAAIRNRAPIALPPPAIELTLTDGLDQPIGRRVFLPREYLAPAVEAPLQPGGELNIHVFLDTGELRAAGYRIFLFYP